MTRLEQAVADLKEADLALKKHTPLTTLEQRLDMAKKAVIAAALDAPSPQEDTFQTDEPEASFTDFSVAPVEAVSEDAQAGSVDVSHDVAGESVIGSTETIDATDEVTIEQAVSAHPNGQLGDNWPGQSV